MIIWSIVRREIHLHALLPDHDRLDPETIRLIPLISATVLAFAAFASFGGNLFTIGNVSIWLLAIAFFVYALWLPYRRVRSERSAEERRRVVVLGMLLFYVAAVVIFFRVYRVNTVPPEPFSDHAEKILDVYDVSQGQTHIFFPRNTGREAIQMYWTLLMSWIFGTGLSFLSLKIGTVIFGLLTLPYMYLLGKEIGGVRVGLFTLFFTGIGYWPNVISRVGLRFPLYPLFVAPTLYYMIRGLRTRNRNDFILSGLFLGLGLHGYSPIRMMPIVVVIAMVLYFLHASQRACSAIPSCGWSFWDWRRWLFSCLYYVTGLTILTFFPIVHSHAWERWTSHCPDLPCKYSSRICGTACGCSTLTMATSGCIP